MEIKPNRIQGYRDINQEIVRSSCLYVATKLGDYLDDMVVVGGLVPSLLVDQSQSSPGFEPHAGTMDLDIGLSLAILDDKRYSGISERLRDARFEQGINENDNPSHQSWRTTFDPPITIDFLIPPTSPDDEGGRLKHIESGFAAWISDGLHLAFQDRCEIELSGLTPLGERASRRIWVCGPGAYTVLKALAFRGRGANKDAYDLAYLWRHIGVDEVVRCLVPHVNDPFVRKAIGIIREEFNSHDGTGPMRAAEFTFGGPDDDFQADVVGMTSQLLAGFERVE